jgi:hypothetical protein
MSERPNYRIRDQLYDGFWLTWDLAYTWEEAVHKLTEGCKARPGRAFRIEEIPDE